MRTFGGAQLSRRLPRERRLLELLDLGELPRSHLFNEQLNGGNDRLANLYELHARKSSSLWFEGRIPRWYMGHPPLVAAAVG